MAMRSAGQRLLGGKSALPEGFGYSVKRRLLGPPLVNEELADQRLSKPLALGVLSPDGISSSAYGTEEILIELIKGGLGVAAFTLILPLTGVVLFVMALVVLSYREVVMVYTRTGGSYVVARENFGPRFAQVAAVALLIDYVVTVAVQVAAGSAAVASAIPALQPYLLEMSVAVVLIMCYLNLRGLKEAGRSFAVPTYLFSGSIILMIIVGLIREALGDLPHSTAHGPATYIGTSDRVTSSLLTFGMIFVMLKAFANGGSSLTGIEAVSNAVGAFRKPEGRNARQVLVTEGLILGFLVAGISWLAHQTHATPYLHGVPTVISQEAGLVFGPSVPGRVMFYLIQAATALILFTGGNTSFNGFPFLANFVAEDAFLPRWLTKRGHRLVFSNGIIVLTVVSIALLLGAGSSVNALVPFYAIGVFTGFSIAGFGMCRYHLRTRERGWRHKLVINFSAGVTTLIVVAIFAVTKFTEGAWLVVFVFPILVFVLIRLNREYRMEARVLARIGQRQPRPTDPPTYARRTVYLFVDDFDLATVAALRYARSLRPTKLTAVHFVIDSVQAATLRRDWLNAHTGVTLDFIDCADRRLARAAAELVSAEADLPGVGVTAILPRRGYSPLLGRLLHDRTADRIAGVVSRIPHAAATIVPFDVRSRLESLQAGAVVGRAGPAGPDAAQAAATAEPATVAASSEARPDSPQARAYEQPVPPPGVSPIGSLTGPGKATVEGRIFAVEIRPVDGSNVLATEIADSTGQLTALFYGRPHIPGMDCGGRVRFRGRVSLRDGQPVMINPAYELLGPGGPERPAARRGRGNGGQRRNHRRMPGDQT
jgi:amino acid transporter